MMAATRWNGILRSIGTRLNLRGLKTKLVLGMTAVAIIPLTFLGLFSNYYVKKTMYEEKAGSSLEIINQVNGNIDNLMQGIEAQISVISTNPNFTNFDGELNHTENGLFLLKRTQESRAGYLRVYFASEKKDFLISHNQQKIPEGFDPTNSDWYKNAVQQQEQLVVSKPQQDTVSNSYFVIVSKAVVYQGKIIGVIGIDLQLDDLSDHINQIKIGETGYVTLMDSEGVILSHPDTALIGTNSGQNWGIWEEVSVNDEGHMTYTFEGKDRFSAFDTNQATGWKVISTIERSEVEKGSNGIEKITVILMVVFSVLSIVAAVLTGRNVARKITIVKEGLHKASVGDMAARIKLKSKDEFNDLEISFNQMIENMSTALSNVEHSSRTVLETATTLSVSTRETSESIAQMANAIHEIAEGTTLQAEDTLTSVSSISSLSERLDHIAESTSQIEHASAELGELSKRGLENVLLLRQKSAETKEATTEVTHIVNDIEEKTGVIHLILETITSISEQTNLLSLNASIEAARAGEHGRGFAVVADEVRALAEQSKTATVKIREIVEGIKLVVNQAVTAMDQTQSIVNDQEAVVEETKAIFQEILQSINELANKVQEVKQHVVESEQHKEYVVKGIESISSVSQQVAATTEQVAASATEVSATMEAFTAHAASLQKLSQQLDVQIGKFKLE